jgi:flavin reductase (DIM6/NTAB) family NADH-FMN oxidoreductase RutF
MTQGTNKAGAPVQEKLALDPTAMTETNVYKIVAGCIIPRPIGFISTLSRAGIANAAPFSFFNGISHAPPLVCLSIADKTDKRDPKDTLANILDTGDFVVNIVDEAIAEAQDRCAATYAADVDEMEAVGLTKVPSKLIRSPRIEESPVNFECTLVRHIPLPESSYTLVIGRIVYMHVRADILLPNGYIDPSRLRAVGRMTGNSYINTRDIFTLKHNTFDVLPAKAE